MIENQTTLELEKYTTYFTLIPLTPHIISEKFHRLIQQHSQKIIVKEFYQFAETYILYSNSNSESSSESEQEEEDDRNLFPNDLKQEEQAKLKLQTEIKNIFYILLPYIEQWKNLQKLYLKPDSIQITQSFLKNITKINFLNLQILCLSSTLIQSIEPLSWFNSPQLTQLFLYNNRIKSLRPLARTNFNKLSRLRVLNSNQQGLIHSLEIDFLNRMQMDITFKPFQRLCNANWINLSTTFCNKNTQIRIKNQLFAKIHTSSQRGVHKENTHVGCIIDLQGLCYLIFSRKHGQNNQ